MARFRNITRQKWNYLKSAVSRQPSAVSRWPRFANSGQPLAVSRQWSAVS
ncbi:MAG: hypothetical protein F6K38_30585 [Moorea sp. SIO3B2]|nr:hypothetical protein [Moorena sp. SIO3B2]